MSVQHDMVNVEQLQEAKAEIERLRRVCKDQAGVELSEENDRLIDALLTIIAHYDEHGAKTKGMSMILEDCRKLVSRE